ncbi:hypothetical protein CB022_21435 [Salmonella enterica]|nr:hypothetical protein [Salmonella enterica]EAW9498461.1 hypothetical protein [Salmonella enterica]EBA8602301.1 hypothetical protein [Salmonella enterica]EBE6297924.1 hypothetical protein [Salmonella enterica]EEP7758016.1 hypothetical protein [Salmonella enterica]
MIFAKSNGLTTFSLFVSRKSAHHCSINRRSSRCSALWIAAVKRDAEIAEATKEKDLKVAVFRKEQETAKADADQACQIQEAIAQQKAVEEQMKVELVRKEREIDLKEKEILVSQKQYDADVKKKADADKYAVEQAAEAEKVKQMRLAEASQYTTESQAKGAAEAEVIRLRGLAEAEARERQAEAFEKFGQAAVLDIVAKMLPELAGKVAAPLASIDKLTVVDSGNGSGALQFSQYVMQLMATVPEMLKNVSGIDVTQLVRGLTEKQDGAPAKPENAEDKDKKEV